DRLNPDELANALEIQLRATVENLRGLSSLSLFMLTYDTWTERKVVGAPSQHVSVPALLYRPGSSATPAQVCGELNRIHQAQQRWTHTRVASDAGYEPRGLPMRK